MCMTCVSVLPKPLLGLTVPVEHLVLLKHQDLKYRILYYICLETPWLQISDILLRDLACGHATVV